MRTPIFFLHFTLATVLLSSSVSALAGDSASSKGSRQASSDVYERARALGNKAVELENKGDLEGALKLNKQALSLYPNSAVGHHNYGNVLEKLGKFEEARQEQERATALKPDMLAGWLSLGIVFEKQKKFPDAERCYRRALEINQNSYGALADLGDILRKQGKFTEAKTYLVRAKAHPNAVDPLEIQKAIDQCNKMDKSE